MTCQLDNKKYDLEERTTKFAEELVVFFRSIKIDVVNQRIITQYIG